MKTLTLIAVAAAAVAPLGGCSSSGSKPSTVGAPLASSSSKPNADARTAALGQPITAGQLKITISGPATVRPTGELGYATFQASMTNTGSTGDVAGPSSFAMRCNGKEFNWVSSTTAAKKRIAPGTTETGTVVLEWAHSTDREDASTIDPTIKDKPVNCTGPTVVEAFFDGQGSKAFAWTVPDDQVAKINTAAAAAPSS